MYQLDKNISNYPSVVRIDYVYVHHLETKPNHFTMVSLVSFFFTQKVF